LAQVDQTSVACPLGLAVHSPAMTGMEVLAVVVGGAYVAPLVGVGAAGLKGFSANKKDYEELIFGVDRCRLRHNLREAHESVKAGHVALTASWRGPLSLFSNRAEKEAVGRGVPVWAVLTVRKAQRLVDKASEMGDLADVYDAQFDLARRKGTGVTKDPVFELAERMDSLGQRLTLHVPALVLARQAFDGEIVDGIPPVVDFEAQQSAASEQGAQTPPKSPRLAARTSAKGEELEESFTKLAKHDKGLFGPRGFGVWNKYLELQSDFHHCSGPLLGPGGALSRLTVANTKSQNATEPAGVDEESPLPIAILRDRALLGELYSLATSHVASYSEALRRAVERDIHAVDTEDTEDTEESQNTETGKEKRQSDLLNSYAQAYLSEEDWGVEEVSELPSRPMEAESSSRAETSKLSSSS